MTCATCQQKSGDGPVMAEPSQFVIRICDACGHSCIRDDGGVWVRAKFRHVSGLPPAQTTALKAQRKQVRLGTVTH